MTGLFFGLFCAGALGGCAFGVFVLIALSSMVMAGTPQEEDVRAGIIRNE